LKRLVRARTAGYLFRDRNRPVNPSSRCAGNRLWRTCDCETNCLNSLLHRLSRLSDNEVSLNRHRYGIENTDCLQTTVVIECESRMLSNVFELYINFLIIEHACFATAFLPSFYSKNCERSSAPKYTRWAKKVGPQTPDLNFVKS